MCKSALKGKKVVFLLGYNVNHSDSLFRKNYRNAEMYKRHHVLMRYLFRSLKFQD